LRAALSSVQLNCHGLDAALPELQQQLQQQQQHQAAAEPKQQQQTLQQLHSVGEPLGPCTPHAAEACLQELQLQLSDTRRQLAESQAAAAEAAAVLAAERAARVAAEDRDAGRQGLLERMATLQVC
jgi:hypothetical protein